MRLVVTGGGTGGHVYPALEVARVGIEAGAELLYLGSLRGQESGACALSGILFQGFPSEPLYNIKSIQGLRALAKLQQSRFMARTALKASHPDVVFSTGGYSAGPVVAAAGDLGIPYVLHSSDSFPARSSKMFARKAAAFTCVFKSTQRFVTECQVTRTGQPIRAELREASKQTSNRERIVLVVGGSQGSAFLNQVGPEAAKLLPDVKFIHVAGKGNYDAMKAQVALQNVEVHPYLETEAIAEAYRTAAVVVARSGGTLAEIAMFGLPSVLIPLPSSANDHQHHNAKEFVEMHAATLLRQSVATGESLASALSGWLDKPVRREQAEAELRAWDVPDATEQIYKIVRRAAGRRRRK